MTVAAVVLLIAVVNWTATTPADQPTIAAISPESEVPMEMDSIHLHSNSTDGVEDYAYQHFFHGVHRGTFVEVGAFDGVTGSHTLALDRQFQWHGLLIEATNAGYLQLLVNRASQVSSFVYISSAVAVMAQL